MPPLERAVSRASAGFTLIEVLIALAITAFVSAIAYASLSTVLSGVESTRAVAERTYEINRAWMIISRDLAQLSSRSIRDEFGEIEPAMTGGPAARYPLTFTRAGWHNSLGLPRSTLQRVVYLVEDETLWRESFNVLDRAGDSEPRRVKLLDGVEYLDVTFLPNLEAVEIGNDRNSVDTRNWLENWMVDVGNPGTLLLPPVALQIVLQIKNSGELRRLYALPPI